MGDREPPVPGQGERPAPGRAVWLPLVLIAAVTIVTRTPYFGDPAPSLDEQLYNLIGNHMLSGSLPYVDLWDRKPIGLFLLFALANSFAGAAGISSAAAYQALAALFTCGGALLTWHLAKRVATQPAALAAGATYPMLIAYYGSQAGQSEAFYVPVMLSMLALVEKAGRTPNAGYRWKLIAGAMLVGGLGLQIKYTLAPQALFLGGYALWTLYRNDVPAVRILASAMLFGVIGLLPTVAALLFYLAQGHGDAFIFANFLSIFDRAAPAGSWVPRILPFLFPIAAFAIAGIAALASRREKPSGTYLLYAGWFVSCLASIFMGSTVYAYYLAALVPGALLMAAPLLSLLGPVTGLAFIAGMLAVYNIPGRIAHSQQGRAAFERMAALIDPHVDAKQCLFVFDGPSALYDATGSCLPTRYIYPDHLNNALEQDALGIDTATEVRRIFAGRPGAVVTANRPLTEQNRATGVIVRSELARNYRTAAIVPFDGRKLTIHVRKD